MLLLNTIALLATATSISAAPTKPRDTTSTTYFDWASQGITAPATNCFVVFAQCGVDTIYRPAPVCAPGETDATWPPADGSDWTAWECSEGFTIIALDDLDGTDVEGMTLAQDYYYVTGSTAGQHTAIGFYVPNPLTQSLDAPIWKESFNPEGFP